MVSKFLNCNKILEEIDMSFCQLDEKAGSLIGKGLRGNRNLQTVILKGNPLKGSIKETEELSAAIETNIKKTEWKILPKGME